MKVLYIVSAYQRHEGDVITPWLVETIRRLKNKEVQVSVLAPSYKGLRSHTVDGVQVERFRYFFRKWENLTHEETAPDRVGRSWFYKILIPFYVVSGMYKAMRICREQRFDVIHVHWPVPHALLGWVGKKFSGSRLVLTFYGVELRWVKNKLPFLRRFISWAIKRADLVTSISSHTQQEIRNYSHKPATIIPFGAGFDVGPVGESAEAQPPEILFVGRLVERKGVKYLVDAFLQLSREMNVKLYIVGEGPEKQALDEQIQRLRIQDKAILTGSIPESELRLRYRKCSVFVLPAIVDSKGDTEGLGVVLIEALLYGKPVIASCIGGIVDIVKDGKTGILVPEKDSRQLAQALKNLLTDPLLRRRLAEDGRQFVQQHFSWDRIIAQLKSAYAGITN